MTDQRTELESLGEFGLIDELTKDFTTVNPETLLGVGDDAAVLDIGNEMHQVVSTDLLIEGVHFDLTYMPLKHLGYKAIAVNVSDICAMNATPKYVTVSFAVSNRFSLEAMEELYSGMQLACENYGVERQGNLLTKILLSHIFNVSTSVRQYASTPVRQYASMPVRQYASTPVRQYTSTPVRQYASMPVRQYASTPVCQYASTPVCQYTSCINPNTLLWHNSHEAIVPKP
jgi:thiamine-monophosphate kinase